MLGGFQQVSSSVAYTLTFFTRLAPTTPDQQVRHHRHSKIHRFAASRARIKNRPTTTYSFAFAMPRHFNPAAMFCTHGCVRFIERATWPVSPRKPSSRANHLRSHGTKRAGERRRRCCYVFSFYPNTRFRELITTWLRFRFFNTRSVSGHVQISGNNQTRSYITPSATKAIAGGFRASFIIGWLSHKAWFYFSNFLSAINP